ncbi:MAG: hypothetical protein ACE5LB_08675 [Acidiferrobacterales bacterium]
MTLSDLQVGFRELQRNMNETDRKLVDQFLSQVTNWVTFADTPNELVTSLDRLLGHSWFSSNDDHAKVHELIQGLQAEVEALPGMTMNERLFTFGLMERWDASSGEQKTMIRRELGVT